MTKAKVGDRIRIVAAMNNSMSYKNGDEGLVYWSGDAVAQVTFDKYGADAPFVYILNKEFEVISSKEEHLQLHGDAPKAGDKVRLVNKPIWVGAYKEGDIGVVVDQWGAAFGYLLVALDNGVYSIPHGQYEVIENDADTSFPERKEEHRPNKDAPASSAEAIRDNILRIREKRNDLKMEINALDKEEADCVEKLKNLGFVLHEEVSSGASKEKKTVLYAEDIEEDMTNPENWEVGDLVTVIENDVLDPFSVGEVVELLEACENPCCKGEGHSKWAMTWEQLKFHSRPL